MRRIGLLVALGALLLAGCGGGGGGGEADQAQTKSETKAAPAPPQPTLASPAPPPTGGGGGNSRAKARYIKKADRVCTDAREKLKPLQAKTVKVAVTNDPAKIYPVYARVTAQAATIYGATAGQLRGLGAPAGDRSEINRLTGLLGQVAVTERQISEAAQQQDGARIRRLAFDANSLVNQFRTGAKAYGFHACARTEGALERRGNR